MKRKRSRIANWGLDVISVPARGLENQLATASLLLGLLLFTASHCCCLFPEKEKNQV